MPGRIVWGVVLVLSPCGSWLLAGSVGLEGVVQAAFALILTSIVLAVSFGIRSYDPEHFDVEGPEREARFQAFWTSPGFSDT